MEEKLFDTVEAAAFLGLSRETVNLLALKGKLPSQKFGRARLIREADLIAFKAIDRKPGRPPKVKDKGDTESAKVEVIATTETGQVPAKPKRKPKPKTGQSVPKPKRNGKKASA